MGEEEKKREEEEEEEKISERLQLLSRISGDRTVSFRRGKKKSPSM